MSDSNDGFFREGNSIRVVNLFEWLDWAGGVNDEVFIALPMIQRGSVWKPQQIIDLWDTLLRGMPVGGLMAQPLGKGEKVRRVGGHELVNIPEGGGLSLLDGQQRTLTMLIPWVKQVQIDKKVWVDFGDKPQYEHLYRLRVTTENHPFGFQKASPSSKLSLGDRNKARKAYDDEYPNDKNVFKSSKPWGSVFPVDLAELIALWEEHKESKAAFIKSVLDFDRDKSDNNREIEARVRNFYQCLARLFSLQIPIIKVGSEMFDSEDDLEIAQPQDDIAPPLAVLFKRIGTGGTTLTDADYVYSLIKYRLEDAYTLVESLHNKHNIASLLSATNLVMSAVRIAAAEFNDALPHGDKSRITDWESPNKKDFHTLLKHNKNFLENNLKPLIEIKEGQGSLVDAFEALSKLLEYDQKENNIGLPKYAFPLLNRPLVQVLLRWIRQVRLHHSDEAKNIFETNRARVIRFVLYWRVFVLDDKEASRVAFRILSENVTSNIFPEKSIYNELVKKSLAIPMSAPDAITHIAFSKKGEKLRGWRRFEVTKETTPEEKCKVELYNRWWGYGGHVHPILLWLQRDFVNNFSGNPMAGRDEETPYDYDHICPSSDWYNNSKTSKDRIIDYLAKENGDSGGHWRVGNSIGNLRVWDSSGNRSDGDDSPAVKILNKENADVILNQSAIKYAHRDLWQECSGEIGKGRVWNLTRVEKFQEAVENRAFALYESYYNDLCFEVWLEAEVHTNSD